MTAHIAKHRRYLVTLTVVFSAFWLWLAIDPVNRRGYFLPFDLTLSTSAHFELMEWAGAAALFDPTLATAYLGTQGDEWDAQKDMALAALGALIAMLVTVGINWRLQRDFGREWADSLRIKHKTPHGEEAIKRMKHGRRGRR